MRGDWGNPVFYRDVMGVVKQGLGCDFDRLHELVNERKTLRKFLGHISADDYHCRYQALVDNVSLLNPKLLGKVHLMIVESGHTVMGKKPGAPLCGRCDVNLLSKVTLFLAQ